MREQLSFADSSLSVDISIPSEQKCRPQSCAVLDALLL